MHIFFFCLDLFNVENKCKVSGLFIVLFCMFERKNLCMNEYAARCKWGKQQKQKS
jgi:hypothetical protein